MATYTGTPRTWTAGETVTAALMNSDMRDPLAALAGAWNSYTPTLSQGASSDIAKTVTYAKYIQVGKLVICQVKLAATAAGTAGSAVTFTLPVTASTSQLMVGVGDYGDGAVEYRGLAYLASTTTCTVMDANQTASAVGTVPSIAVASGDTVFAAFVYEAA